MPRHRPSPLLALLLASALPLAALSCSDTESGNPTVPVTTPDSGAAPPATDATPDAPTEAAPPVPADCDPLAPTRCGFPFPSNTALVDDATSKTGKRVAFKKTTLPYRGAQPTNPKAWADADGFSPNATLMAHLPGASITGLPTQDTIDVSLSPSSPTIVLDAATGERVPHFSELDMSAKDDTQRAFMIRPVVRLKDATRYIVAIRNVVDSGGKKLDPAPAFVALRDGKPFDHPSIEPRRALYADILAKLEKAGVAKGDLQLAWDFTTASRENNTGALLAMRDDALAKVGDDGPAYVLDKVTDNPNDNVRRQLEGRMTVPLYLDKPGPGAHLVLGPDGLPKQNGTAQYSFVVYIPNAAVHGTPGALLQNGHGLLGSKFEGGGGYLTEIANKKNFVAFSVDLVGMSKEDQPAVGAAVAGDIGTFRSSIDRQHQGILNSLLAMRMMKGRFAKDPQVQFEGKSAIDTTQAYYRGDSQGGIFGGTYMALTTDVTRGLLSVPGAPYSLLLNRSSDFTPFFVLLNATYESSLDVQLGLGLIQMLWDRTEPGGYIAYINENMLPKTPKHEILFHVAIGDHQVAPLGAHFMARALHAKNVNPYPRKIWGLEEAKAPITGSAIVEFDFGLPESPKFNIPPTAGKDPHGKVRKIPDAYGQADVFFRTGVVQQFCTGWCKGT